MESRRSDRTKSQLFVITVLVLALLSACSNSSDQELTSTNGHQDVESVDVEMPDSTSPDTQAEDAPETEAEDITPPPRIAFVELATAKIYEDGRTLPINAPIPESSSALALRIIPQGKDDYSGTCYTLDNMNDNDGNTWIPEYKGGLQSHNFAPGSLHRAYVTFGSGVYVFPNNGTPLEAQSLDFTISLRDCITRIPADAPFNTIPDSLLVEMATWKVPENGSVGIVDVHLVVASKDAFDPDDLAKDTLLATAFEHAQKRYQKGNIELRLSSLNRLQSTITELEFSNTDRTNINALFTDATKLIENYDEDNSIIVIMPTCLKWVDQILQSNRQLVGHVPRIPGGFAQNTGADAVFLTAETCNLLEPGLFWKEAETLGTALAHEIGHFLGLYHVQEKDGIEDHIQDTKPDDKNIMAIDVLDDTDASEFSPQQIQVLRANPLVQYEGDE